MDWLPQLLKEGSTFYGVFFVVFSAIIVGLLLKNKSLIIKTSHFSLGSSERERTIVRHQMHYIHVMCDGVCEKIPAQFDRWRTKFVMSRVSDVLEEAVLYNHIDVSNKEYIEVKQQLAYSAVLKNTSDDYFKTPEFKEFCDSFIFDTLKSLQSIRKQYE